MPKAKPRFRPYNLDQNAMIVINYQDQLQPGTFEHAVHYLIEHKLDLSIFHPKYRNEDTGRLACDPAILAKFVSSHADEIEDLLEQVLLVCHEQGLLGNELFAIHGCKMSSNAANEWSGTVKELEEEVKSNITDNESAKMPTSKGVVQGYNGVATVDKKRQIVIDAQAFGEGLEHHTLQPVLETVETRFKQLGIAESIYQQGTIITADTGFANEANMKYLHEKQINGYIPDNKFRSRDPKFDHQKDKYGKRHQNLTDKGWKDIIPASEFQFDPVNLTCICPTGETLTYRGQREAENGKIRVHFEGRILQCRHCPRKHQCMQNPASANHRNGSGRQVSFTLENKRQPNYTDWMKHRVDSQRGKEIYSHRMSVVEPVFGNIGTNKRLNRFSLRGKKKVQGQWQLYCLVHNIEKLANYGQLVA